MTVQLLNLDSVLVELGEFGKFQAWTYLLICVPVMFSAANSLTYVFTAGVPPYRCFVPGCDSESEPHYSEGWLQNAIPPSDESSRSPGYVPAQCLTYVRNSTQLYSCAQDDFNNQQTVQCDQWVFYPDEITIVNEWMITCHENQWKLSLVGTIHFAGILFGSLLLGYMADRFGRKIILILSLTVMSVTGIVQAVSPDYAFFQVFVFLNAIATSGVYPLAFILGVELVGPNKRNMSSIIINYFYAVGEAAVGIIAWLSGNWKILQLTVSAPAIIFVIYHWLVPESVRWLLSKKQHTKALGIIKYAAKTNGVILSENIISSLNAIPSDIQSTNNIWELWKSRKIVIRSLILFYIWIANAFVYYGLSVNSTSLGGNKYVNFTLVCLVEIPGYTLAWVLLRRGRCFALTSALFLCAVTSLAAAFVPADVNWAVLALFLTGKVGITSSFGTLYVHTAEMYPTSLRSACVGICSTMARFGAMVAPFVPLLGYYSPPLPLLLFGAVALIAGLLSFLLPETKGIPLPDTVKDAEKL